MLLREHAEDARSLGQRAPELRAIWHGPMNMSSGLLGALAGRMAPDLRIRLVLILRPEQDSNLRPTA